MKVRPNDLQDRLVGISAALRGAEPLERPAPKAPPAFLEGVLRSVADRVADEVIERLTKYRDTNTSFGVVGLMNQAIKERPEQEQEQVWRSGFSGAIQDRLSIHIHAALAQRGYSAALLRFDSRDNYDGMLELHISGAKAGVEESTEAHARLVRGPNRIDPQQGAVRTMALHTTARLLSDAAVEAQAFDKFSLREEAPESIRKATVALEKAARQLEQLRGTQVGPEQAEPYRDVQRAYASLLFTLSGFDFLDRVYRGAGDADRELLRRGERSGLQQIAAALLEKTGITAGNFERRIQEALVSLYESAPLSPTRPTKISATDYVSTQLSWASPEVLADPVKADLLLKQARQLEMVDLAVETKDFARARDGLRGVASDLSLSLGPALVTGQMIARLGDLELLAGRDDKASRAYVGALRVMKLHLPNDHALIREVATKLKQSGERWIASLDTDPKKPMPFEARSARSEADAVAKELELDAILNSKAPAITADPGVGPAAFAEALGRARPGELHTPPSETYWQLHYAIFGPMRD